MNTATLDNIILHIVHQNAKVRSFRIVRAAITALLVTHDASCTLTRYLSYRHAHEALAVPWSRSFFQAACCNRDASMHTPQHGPNSKTASYLRRGLEKISATVGDRGWGEKELLTVERGRCMMPLMRVRISMSQVTRVAALSVRLSAMSEN